MECREFGKTGMKPSILGFGMMRLKKNEDGTLDENTMRALSAHLAEFQVPSGEKE